MQKNDEGEKRENTKNYILWIVSVVYCYSSGTKSVFGIMVAVVF